MSGRGKIRASEFSRILNGVREKNPLVHHITNYVTVNDCANITLAIGASPIMADAAEESAEIAAVSSAVVLNIGTLNPRLIESAIAAALSANESSVPVILDPVGAGASALRNEAVARILGEARVDVIRGNISEVSFIGGLASNTKGVDASDADRCGDAGRIASDLASARRCIVAVTGAVDAVSDGARTVRIENGHPALSAVTGTGCMCSSLVGAFCGASPDTLLAGAVAGVLSMGVAGELAHESAGALGLGSFRTALIDAVSRLTPEELERRARLYEA